MKEETHIDHDVKTEQGDISPELHANIAGTAGLFNEGDPASFISDCSRVSVWKGKGHKQEERESNYDKIRQYNAYGVEQVQPVVLAQLAATSDNVNLFDEKEVQYLDEG